MRKAELLLIEKQEKHLKEQCNRPLQSIRPEVKKEITKMLFNKN